MVIPPLIGNPYNGYINPYYWVDDHPLLYGNNGSLDPGANGCLEFGIVHCQSAKLRVKSAFWSDDMLRHEIGAHVRWKKPGTQVSSKNVWTHWME